MARKSFNSRLEQLESTVSITAHPDTLTDREKFKLCLEFDAIHYVQPVKAIEMPLTGRCRRHWGARVWRKYLGEYNNGKFLKGLSKKQKDYLLYGDVK